MPVCFPTINKDTIVATNKVNEIEIQTDSAFTASLVFQTTGKDAGKELYHFESGEGNGDSTLGFIPKAMRYLPRTMKLPFVSKSWQMEQHITARGSKFVPKVLL